MGREIADAILVNVEGLIYDYKAKRYILDVDWVNNAINENLELLYPGVDKDSSKKNAKEILDRDSRHVYNNVYDEKTWPEDFDKKQYLILTTEATVKITRDIMISHLESVILTRRDKLIMESAVDLDGNKLIEDFDKNMKEYQFALDTRRIFNQDRNLRYKERLTNRDIDPSLIREGY